MPFRVEITPAARRDLRQLPPQVQARLEPVILALGDEPRPPGTRKVQGRERTFRIRVGAYRVLFDVFDDERVVLVHAIRGGGAKPRTASAEPAETPLQSNGLEIREARPRVGLGPEPDAASAVGGILDLSERPTFECPPEARAAGFHL